MKRVMADVKLARKKGVSSIFKIILYISDLFPERSYPSALSSLTTYIKEPHLPSLIHTFLHQQFDISDDGSPTSKFEYMPDMLEMISPISVFHSAIATFYAPSDISGICGMRRKRIRSTPVWRATGPRKDCVFVVENQEKPGFRGMSVVRVKIFFSFIYEGEEYPCALVEWFKKIGTSPEEQTGMWVVKPENDNYGRRLTSVVHINTIQVSLLSPRLTHVTRGNIISG